MRRAAKRDDNEASIVTALQSAGWTVVRVSDTGVPDMLCAKAGRLVLLEVKSEDGTLTEAQKETFERLAGAGVAVRVVRSPGEALTVLDCPYASYRWLAVNGAYLCEQCWLPENGLHAKDCPTRKALAKSPKVQSAYRAAKALAEALPKEIEVHRTVELGMVGQPPDIVRHSVETISRPEAVRRGLVTTEQVKAALEEMRAECECVRMEPFPPPLRGMRFVADENCKRCLGRATRRPSRGVEGELQPLKVKR